MSSTAHPSYLQQHSPGWLIDSNTALAYFRLEANVTAVYTLPGGGQGWWWGGGGGGGGGGLMLEARVQFFLFKDLQGKICCTQMTWQSSSKTQLMDHSLLLISSHLFFFFSFFFCWPLLWGERAFGAKAASWAMAPERRTAAPRSADCILLNQSLSAFLVSW